MSRNRNQTHKSCDAKHMAESEPNSDWELDQLSNYAQEQHSQILDGERRLTPTYWRLGCALILARKACKHGKWGEHLESLGIDRSRASKARAIFRTFDNVADVGELTVQEAYDLRDSKRTGADAATKRTLARFRKSLDRVAERTSGVLEEAIPMAPKDAENLLPAVRGAIAKLEELVQSLEIPVNESANDEPADALAEAA